MHKYFGQITLHISEENKGRFPSAAFGADGIPGNDVMPIMPVLRQEAVRMLKLNAAQVCVTFGLSKTRFLSTKSKYEERFDSRKI